MMSRVFSGRSGVSLEPVYLKSRGSARGEQRC
jgi:hypothetical protein